MQQWPAGTSANEGSQADFSVTTTNVAAGTVLSYTISGVSAADVGTGSLNGTVTVGSNGVANIAIPIVADSLTEGAETLTVTLQGQSSSIIINDTSKALTALSSYYLSASNYSLNEGSTASFTLTTKNVASGTSVPYTISGISAADVSGGSLSGSAVVDSSGVSTISVTLINDNLTEGSETLTITAGGVTASTVVNDTSTTAILLNSVGIVIQWARSSTVDKVSGGQGIDKLEIPAKRSEFTFSKDKGVTDLTTGKAVGLQSVERVQFVDISLAVDLDGNAGKAVQALGAVFGKDSVKNKELVGIALSVYDKNTFSDTQVVRLALDVALGKSPTNEAVVDLLYKNLAGFYPDPTVKNFYVTMINSGIYTQESITLLAMGTDLNKSNIDLVGLANNGVEFAPSIF